MITKKLKDQIFGWDPAAWKGKGYWYVLGTKGGLGRAASKSEYTKLGSITRGMTYQGANKIREKGLFGNILEKLVNNKDKSAGKSIKEGMSESWRASAKKTGERFDSMNIVKALAGKAASAAWGRFRGRSQADIEHFSEMKAKTGFFDSAAKGSKKESVVAGTKLYEMLKKSYEDKKLRDDLTRDFSKEERDEENRRNEKLIDAIKKAGKEKKTPPAKKPEGVKTPTVPVKTPTGPAKPGAPGAPKPPTAAKVPEVPKTPTATKPPVEAAKPPTVAKPPVEAAKPPTAAKPPAAKPAPEAPRPVPKAEVPTAKPTPKPPEAPTAKVEPKVPAVKPKIPTAGKVAAGAAAGGIATTAIGTGAKAAIIAALTTAGIAKAGQANILASVESESNFKAKSENMNYSSAERIQKVFGKRRFPTLEDAKPYVGQPEKLANYVYKTTDGNSEEGDGWKYRGRGYLQHTGKNQYVAISKYTGIDVLSNPDLLNTPEVAAKAVPWFFLKYKGKKPEQLDNMETVNKAVGFAGGQEESEKRNALSEKYKNETGDQLNQSSTENKDLKTKNTAPGPVSVNNQTTVIGGTKKQTVIAAASGDSSQYMDRQYG